MADAPGRKSPKPSRFAGIPKRAIGDQRFSTIHFRVLAAVAAHDWMSAARGKGAGCYASNLTLARMCGVNYSNFSTAITELGRWGYVEASMHPLSKRTRVYRVIYDDGTNVNTLPEGKQLDQADSLPTGKASASYGTGDGLPEYKNAAETLCPPNSQAADFIEHPNDNIFSETVRDSAKQQDSSVETANWLRNGDAKTVGTYLAKLERRLKEQGDFAQLDPSNQEYLEVLAEEEDSPLIKQARRILATWGAEL